MPGDGSKVPKDTLGFTAALELLGEWATQKEDDLTVAVVGTTNVSLYLSHLYFTK